MLYAYCRHNFENADTSSLSLRHDKVCIMKLHSMKTLSALSAIAISLSACGSGNDNPPTVDGPGEFLVSSLERNLAPTVSETTRAQLSANNQNFAFDLLH